MASSADVSQRYNGVTEIFCTDPKCQGIVREITEMNVVVALRDDKLKRDSRLPTGSKIMFAVAVSMYSQYESWENSTSRPSTSYEDLVRGGKKMSVRIGQTHKTIRYVIPASCEQNS